MSFISLILGKAILGGLRLLGRSGTALPGLVVEKLQPSFLSGMLSTLPEGVIVVTGTNGKTTTTKIITTLLEGQGKRVLTNKTGSNFVRGIVTTVIDKATFTGKLPYDVAVLEQDEAHAVHFVNQVKPRGVVALNIMRDQMDRFGEIDTTARLLKTVVHSATDWVLLNANDERVGKLKPPEPIKTYWYGHAEKLQLKFLTDDQMHHGDNTKYTCAGIMDAELVSYTKDIVKIRTGKDTTQFEYPLSGSHNAINLTAALASVYAALPAVDKLRLQESVGKLQPAFGRGEIIKLKDGLEVILQLVKNPSGFTHALRLLELENFGVVGVAINDDYADGRDVSWLWDVDFSILKDNYPKVICGGSRGYDMAVRLKYDEVPIISADLNIGKFVKNVNQTAAKTGKTAIIYCTYTAMLKVRSEYTRLSKDVYGVRV